MMITITNETFSNLRRKTFMFYVRIQSNIIKDFGFSFSPYTPNK